MRGVTSPRHVRHVWCLDTGTTLHLLHVSSDTLFTTDLPYLIRLN